MTGIGRRALLKGSAAITPGLGRPASSRSAPGDDPAARQVVRARQVIVSGKGDGEFVYAAGTTPKLGNPPVAWVTGGSLVDPYGNVLPSTMGVAGTGTFQAVNSSNGQTAQLAGGIVSVSTPLNTAPASMSAPTGFGGLSQIFSPLTGTGDTSFRISLYSKNGSPTGAPFMLVSDPVVATNPDGSPETWNPITLDTSAGWSTNAHYHAPQYRLLPDGNVQFSGLVSRAPFTDTIPLNPAHPLPNAYRPSKIKAVCQGSPLGSRARVEFHSDGILYAVGTRLFTVTTAEIEGTVSST